MSTSPVRYLCVDLGDKRTGLAVSDSVTRLVTPLEVLEVPVSHEGGAALIRAIVSAAREQVGERGRLEVVVGLPLVQEGKEGPRARQVRAFAERLRAAQAVIGCAKSYGALRLEAACDRALGHNSPHYRTVKSILASGADLQPLVEPETPAAYSRARFARSAAELFGTDATTVH